MELSLRRIYPRVASPIELDYGLKVVTVVSCALDKIKGQIR